MENKNNLVFIQKACSKDIDAMISLLKLLFAIEQDFVFDEDKHRLGLQMMLKDEERSCILVAKKGNNVLGMITGQLLISTAEGAFSVKVEDLAVAKEYQGFGVGNRLLANLEKWAAGKGASRMELLADQENLSALQFYHKLNWKKTRLIALHKKINGLPA